MVNINLRTDNQPKESEKSGIFGKGTIALAVVLFLSLAAYFGLLSYGKNLDAKIKEAKDSYDKNLADFTSDKNKQRVVDFANRLAVAENLMGKKEDPAESLKEIEKIIIPGVYISSYKMEKSKKELALLCVGSDFNVVAKQIFNFKEYLKDNKETIFSDAIVGESALDSKGTKVNFSVILKLK